jgi:hypothetical protein
VTGSGRQRGRPGTPQAEALALLEGQLADQAEPAALPEFFGMLHSGKGDLAARSDEILRAEFGRR